MTDAGAFPSLARRARQIGQDGAAAFRMARDLPGFLRTPIALDDARARVRHALAHREAHFLDMVDRAIYGYLGSPYLALLRHAGCEFGDVQRLVAHEGLEGALTILAGLGVYVTFDEFKGRREAVRGSARFHFKDTAFDSPIVPPHWFQYTGGTRGTPNRVARSLALIDDLTAIAGSMLYAHNLDGARHAFWIASPMAPALTYLKLGQEVVRWMIPARTLPNRYMTAARLFSLGIRLSGRSMPRPLLVDQDRLGRVVEWIGRRPRDGRQLVFSTLTSIAVRLATEARAAGLDLSDVTFRLQSEPLTEARVRVLRATGARVVDNYSLSEAQDIGFSCAAAASPSDLHVSSYRYALVERQRPLVRGGPTIDALLLTTIAVAAAKVCLNVETGDYATIERRTCACDLGTLGLTTHLRDVRSFEKLSTEGVSFVRTRLLQILEEILPARFGGSPLDYQLLEVESPDTSSRLLLRVSPAAGAIDEEALRAAFLAELSADGIVDYHQAELLRRAQSVAVVRQAPLPTRAGKVLPFHLVRNAEAASLPPVSS